jgi:anti-sigma regulatory factor (Ser/Thr protein kinase)
VVRDAVDHLEVTAPIRENARLVASELVTNAVLHSGCFGGQTIEVDLTLHPECLVISVDEPCVAGQTPLIRTDDDDPVRGGFGLRIVDRLARDWGATHDDGHRVWAEIALG